MNDDRERTLLDIKIELTKLRRELAEGRVELLVEKGRRWQTKDE